MRNRVFIKVQDGCDNFCSYCIVPHLRGRSTSRRINEIIDEIKTLPDFVKEVVLTGIDLSSFTGLGELCAEIDRLFKETNRTFRLSSIEVRIITDEFLNVLKSCKSFCQSFHIPLQSGSDNVLKAMNRKYTTAEYLRKVNLVRSIFPDSQITTDVICGFPSETESDFLTTVEFIKSIGFLDCHIFPYSQRTGTAAAHLAQLPNTVITRRAKELTEIQKEISNELKEEYLGKIIIVLFENRKNGFSFGTSREYFSVKAKGSHPLDWQKVTIDGVETVIL